MNLIWNENAGIKTTPQILAVEKDYLVVYKPPGMHSAPLAASKDGSILDFCAGDFPEVAELHGRKAGEGGLLHRLDYDTQGLLLIARSQKAMEALHGQQKSGEFIKEYSALTMDNNENHANSNPPDDNFAFFELRQIASGFPLLKPVLPFDFFSGDCRKSFSIMSAFRPYGPGRKEVRPVMLGLLNAGGKMMKPKGLALDMGNPYVTEILKGQQLSQGINLFFIKLYRGFRHQIRCHLSWLGLPVLNDDLYGGSAFGKGLLALRAHALIFNNPSSGERRVYSIPPIEPEEISDSSGIV